MKILLVADIESRALWDFYDPSRVEGVDLILSAGDLKPEYLEFLVTMVNCPLYYVRGNHDDRYEERPPEGCEDIDGRIVNAGGIRILGLGGSYKYNLSHNMYTEEEMSKRIRKVEKSVRKAGGVDILLTHAPAAGFGDLDDLPHRGFRCFNGLLEEFRPAYMVHGHVHKSYGGFERERTHRSGTRIINAYESAFLEAEPLSDPALGRSSFSGEKKRKFPFRRGVKAL